MKANSGQLRFVYNTLSEYLPNFFVKQHCFHIYSADVVLEDNIRNIRTTGIAAYKHNATLFRLYSFVKYHKLEMDILKMTENLDESCIKVRWRVIGSPNWEIFIHYFYPPLDKSKSRKSFSEEVWIDGFSIYYVNDQGKVFKHILDKLMPDDNYAQDRKKSSILDTLQGKAASFATKQKF